MPYVGPMTLTQLLQEIHILFSNGTDYPAVGEEDYIIRVALLNNYIRAWSRTPGVKWKSLFDVKTGQMVAAAGDSSFVCDTRFRRVAGRVQLSLNGSTLDVPIYSQERLDDKDLAKTYCYFAGKPGSYSLYLVGVPSNWVGANIRYRYYRYATTLVDPTDVSEVPDPNFLVYSVTARLFQLSHNNTSYTIYFNDAQESLEGMETENLELEIEENTEPISQRIHNIGIMGS